MTGLGIASLATCGGCSIWQVIQYYFKIGREWTVWAFIAVNIALYVAAVSTFGDAGGRFFLASLVVGFMSVLITVAMIAAGTRQRWRDVLKRCMNIK